MNDLILLVGIIASYGIGTLLWLVTDEASAAIGGIITAFIFITIYTCPIWN